MVETFVLHVAFRMLSIRDWFISCRAAQDWRQAGKVTMAQLVSAGCVVFQTARRRAYCTAMTPLLH
jgi:hypothetical protein